jgi:hypothetical protein
MRRVFDLDVLACPRCGGRLQVIATVQDDPGRRAGVAASDLRRPQDVRPEARPAAPCAHGKRAGRVSSCGPFPLVRLAKARHRASRDGLLYFVGAEHRFREVASDDELPAG